MNTAELLKLDLKHVWHPFTQHQLWPHDEPLIIERAEGNWLIDTDGRRYLDAISSLWCNVHGHRKRELDEAIVSQLQKVAHTTMLGFSNVPAIQLADALTKIAPKGLSRVFYSDSGSTAVEVALKMAYQFQQLMGRNSRRRFAALPDAYHGDTLGSVSVGGMPLFHQRFSDLVFPVDRLPTQTAQLETWFSAHASELAAVIVEPLMQGAAGMRMQPRGYLKALETCCRKNGVLLICDEVATGFGRTGTMFAVEQEDVQPDLLCLAKGLTGGYLPLAATLATESIFEAYLGSAQEQKTFFHGHTFTGNPLACAVALANLELFQKEEVLRRIQPLIETLTTGLSRIAKLSSVVEVRQRGLMVGIEVKGQGLEARSGFRVCQVARLHGLLLRPLGDVVVLMPPLSLTLEEADQLIRGVEASIQEVL